VLTLQVNSNESLVLTDVVAEAALVAANVGGIVLREVYVPL